MIKINNVEVVALIDTGSVVNAISEEWFLCNKQQLGRIEMLRLHNTNIKGAIGKKSKLIKNQILAEIDINKMKFDVVFLIIPGLIRDCILGMDLLQDAECVINIPQQKLKLKDNTHEVELLTMQTEEQDDVETDINKVVQEVNGITELQRSQLYKILMRHKEVFSSKPGRITCYEHQFRVTDSTPFCQKGWPVPIAYRQQVEDEINKMVRYGVIERSASPYINPLVTVIKKDGSVRLCLDARKLNDVTIPDYEGVVPINELLTTCENMKFISGIDLTSSFWQIPLSRECRDYTGFLYKGKCYRFTVTPFGLKTSLASLTRGLDAVLEENVKNFTKIYVDDCLCLSRSVEEHLYHLDLLLNNFKCAQLTINLKKSQLFRKEINYLGYCLTTEGIKATPDKVSAIVNFPRPKNPKQLKGFLGLTNFYNRFTKKYAETVQPLLQLLKKGNTFKWNEQLEQQFINVKELFLETVILHHPDPKKQYFLQTDASNYALGGQLYQLDHNGDIAVIAYTSRTFKGAELNYNTTEKELLSIVHCLKKFRIYVLGQKLTIVTDNKALTFIKKCHLNNSRITRWILGIQEYNFNIIHCSGKENIVADLLSRCPEDAQEEHKMNQPDELDINVIQKSLSKEMKHQLKAIGKNQMLESKLTKIIQEITSSGNNKTYDKYQWYNGKLYRQEKGKWRLMIPNNMSHQFIQEIHENYGHPGVKKTTLLFKEYFTCNQSSAIIKKLIKKCPTCQKCKDHTRAIIGETRPVVPTAKGELVSMDYFGPLPTSTAGVKYLLVMVDNFTKFVKLYSLKRATTISTLNRVKQYIDAYGKPKAILTDNGTQFTTNKWIKGLNELNIQPRFTAIRNPCTNLAERVNRQLGNLFRVFVKEKHTKWAQYLKIIETCLNETVHETTQTTPYAAQFGEPPKREWRQYIDMEVIKEEPVIKQQDIFLRIKNKREREAHKFNQKHKITKFNVGDLVLVKAYHLSDAMNKIVSKFCELYEGPYRIRTVLSTSTYVLEHLNEPSKLRGTFNVRQMKPYYGD
jgi:transposase InsO family protein